MTAPSDPIEPTSSTPLVDGEDAVQNPSVQEDSSEGEIRIDLFLDEGETVRIGETDGAFDDRIRTAGGRTWVAIALGKNLEKSLAKLLTKLEGSVSLPGRIQITEDGKEKLTPARFVMDLPRRRARELAKKNNHDAFYWGAVGTPAERHHVEAFEVEWDTGENSMHRQALAGMGDARQAVLDLIHNPKGQPWQPDDVKRTGWMLAGWVAVVSVAYAFLPLVFSDGSEFDDDRRLLKWILHPAWGVAIVLGLHLRRILEGLGKRSDQRDLTGEESEQVWRGIAPSHAALWLAAIAAITLTTIARGVFTYGWSAVDLADLWSNHVVISLWALPAIAYAHSIGQAFERLLSAAVWLFLALLGMRFALMFANWLSNLIWGIIEKAVHIDLPDFIEPTWNLVFALAAELSFAGYMLGYTWVHERKHFVLWSSDELTDD